MASLSPAEETKVRIRTAFALEQAPADRFCFSAYLALRDKGKVISEEPILCFCFIGNEHAGVLPVVTIEFIQIFLPPFLLDLRVVFVPRRFLQPRFFMDLECGLSPLK